ncbi:hypothetical protein ACFQFQ_16345 [Sulfitobacter porphyrae]|uniref:Aldehyde oxidase/xanthine dehydrogenase a/b hammerhead domain-containing protein n=1 Tax=Sulfitobacter porphyrae TaxID=1246864 RepID=A0ABW2B4P7_9RHOB
MKNAHDPSLAVMDLPRRDARDKLRGRTRYTVDQAGPEVLHAVLLRATVASARITRLDVTPALTMAGVNAIATHRDAPGLHGIGIADHPIFACDIVRYHGEPLAVIAAETLALARRAAKAVIVEYEAMPPVLTLQAALAPDAPSSIPAGKATRCSTPARHGAAISPGKHASTAATPTQPLPAMTSPLSKAPMMSGGRTTCRLSRAR